LLESIKGFLDKINAPPKSLLGVAATYCKNQWDELTRYVDYGESNISHCGVENQVRPFAVGRRNWLFVSNEVSASKAALIYRLIQSCIMNDLDPRSYLECGIKPRA
jgi:transposase